jgi:hypothetical protein
MNQKENLSLTGEVVEIYEKDGKRVAKIRFNPGFVEVPIDDLHDTHLNDKITINSKIKIERILHNLDNRYDFFN